MAAQRYAKALNAALTDAEALEPALNWLQTFAELITANGELRQVLQNPSLPMAARASVLEDVLAKLEPNPVLLNFIREIFRRKRMDIVAEIAEIFGHLVDDRLNRITARVTTAQPVTDQQAEKIRAGLAAYADKDVHLKLRVDADIIGGLTVKIDGTIIDGSLRSRLKQLRQALLSEENGTV